MAGELQSAHAGRASLGTVARAGPTRLHLGWRPSWTDFRRAEQGADGSAAAQRRAVAVVEAMKADALAQARRRFAAVSRVRSERGSVRKSPSRCGGGASTAPKAAFERVDTFGEALDSRYRDRKLCRRARRICPRPLLLALCALARPRVDAPSPPSSPPSRQRPTERPWGARPPCCSSD